MARADATLRSQVGGEPIVAWTRGWTSHEHRLHRLLAARTLDVAVLTESRLSLLTIGFFTRRPRRCVYAVRLDEITVTDVPVRRGRRLIVTCDDGHRMRLELSSTPRASAFASALLARTGARRR